MAKNSDIKRRLIQLYSALLYNAHIRGFAEGEIFTGKTKAVCVPGFNCYSCPGAIGACPLGSLQNALGSLNKNIGFYVFGIILLYGMLLGRTICGWICPLGLIQELLHKIPTPKIRKSRITRGLSYLKYVILVVFAVIIPIYYGIMLGIPVPGFCKYICPAGTFEGAMGMLPKNPAWLSMLGPIFTRKFVIMVTVGLACIFCYRSFCRFLCPLGAIYGMFNKISVIGVRVDTGSCNNCGACVRNCKMDVKQVGDHECIHCAKCVAVCNQRALSMKAGKFTLIPPKSKDPGQPSHGDVSKKAQTICWSIAVIVLAFLLIWTNFLDPSLKKDESAADNTVVSDTADTDAPGQGEEQEEVQDTQQNEAEVDAQDEASDETADETSNEATDAVQDEDVTEDADDAQQSDAPVGYEVGDRLQDFEAECLDGSTFKLADHKGEVVFINLWATYCGPCVKELPHFVELYHEHEGDMAILAVHANLTTEDVGEYLKDKDWDIKFAVDDDNESIFKIVNGDLALPQTIVLNRKGEVIYNKVGSVTKEMLDQLYEEASD